MEHVEHQAVMARAEWRSWGAIYKTWPTAQQQGPLLVRVGVSEVESSSLMV